MHCTFTNIWNQNNNLLDRHGNHIWSHSVNFLLAVDCVIKQSKGHALDGRFAFCLSSVPPLWKKLFLDCDFILCLIRPALHNEAVLTWEVKFCACRKSLNSIAFDEPVKVLGCSSALSVWLFSIRLHCEVWTQSLCVDSLFSLPHCQVTATDKETLLSCSLCTFPLVSVSFYTPFPFLTTPR